MHQRNGMTSASEAIGRHFRAVLERARGFTTAEQPGQPADLATQRKRIDWPAIAAILGAAIALLVLIGWAFDIAVLMSPNPGWVTVKPNSAIGMLLCSGALWSLRPRSTSRRRVLIGRILAAAAVLLGVLTIFQDLYVTSIGIDRLLFGEPNGTPWTAHPGRMAPSVSMCIALLGTALLLLDTQTQARRWPSEFLVAAVLLISVPRLVGYVFGVVPSGISSQTVMPAYTSVAMVILATGILATRPERGLFAILSSPAEGGRTARRLVPAAFLLPLAFGLLLVIASARGVVAANHVAPDAVSAIIVSFVVLALFAAWKVRQGEIDREATMHRLEAQNAATRALIESTTVAEATPRFLASTGDSLGWDFAALWQMDRAGALECVNVWHRPEVDVSSFEEATKRLTLAPGVELPGLVWIRGEPEWVPDIQRSPSLRGAAAARGGLGAGFAFPVRYDNDIRGVIEFFGQGARDPDRDLLAIAPILGRQIGEAIERKRAEELLRASEDRFRSVAESATDALVTVDGDSEITYANPATEHMFGYGSAELIGKPIALLLPGVGNNSDLSPGRTAERLGRGKDGNELPVEISAARWATGEGIFTTLIVRDVGDRKRAEQELRKARDSAEALNRELEAFSYSVSHDLRTPVRSIDGFSQAMLEDYGEQLGEEGRHNLLRLRAAAERMSELIDDLLELSRTIRAPLHQQEVDLSSLAREIAQDLSATEPDRMVEFVIGEGVVASADPRLMRVVLQNLLENAWKFSARQTPARIQFGSFFDGGRAVYFVQDNGIGFEMAFRERLFTPFQRLHDDDGFPGTGVGLALVQRIVSRHGGTIWAESALGRGATFYFTLAGESVGRVGHAGEGHPPR